MSKPILTIFTPTFNRAYCLGNLYHSLLEQTNKNFIWLIVDDGSTDKTKDLVDTWIKKNLIEIQYLYQENQGMHGAHNTAYENINTLLNVCIDSDDFMPREAVAKIFKTWNNIECKEKVAGLIGYDEDIKGNIIGKEFPRNLTYTTLEDLYFKYHVPGDKKIVYKTEIIKKYPKYPIFDNERFVPLGTLYLLIDKDHDLYCCHHSLCVVEYREDGSSRNILRQYLKNPMGFRYARVINMEHSSYLKNRLKNSIHFVSHNLHLRDLKGLLNSPKPMLTLLAFPPGVVLSMYVWFRNKLAP